MCVPMSRIEQLALKAAHSWAGRVKLDVDHHGIERGVTEQRLDDVDGRVVVEVLGGEHPPAVMRAQHQLGAVGPAGAGGVEMRASRTRMLPADMGLGWRTAAAGKGRVG